MNYLVIPAVVSLLVKGLILYFNKDSLAKNYFTATLTVCVLHSFCEVITFYKYFSGADIETLFRCYYVLSIWWLAFAFIHSKEVSGITKGNSLIISGSVILSVLVLFTDLVLSGYIEKGYAVTAVQEEYYFIFKIFVLFSILGSIFLLVRQAFFKQSSIEREIQCLYLLAGFVTPFLTALIVIASLHFGWEISAIGILPIANLFFFIFIVQSESEHKLVDIRRLLPWSKENAFAKEMNRIAAQCSLGEITLKEADDAFQRALIKYQTESTGNNITQTANKLGLSKSTLYSKMAKLDIPTREEG